jgi:hypothetical protein
VDYNDISRNACYLLTIIRAYLDSLSAPVIAPPDHTPRQNGPATTPRLDSAGTGRSGPTLAGLLVGLRGWYDAGKEVAMIELTEQQVQALENTEAAPPRVVNPRTRETFVLLRVEEYERLKDEYDDSPWTREELQALAWERVKHEDWDEYDDLPEKP